MVTAAALFFRRATPAGGMACLVMGVGYALIGAVGGWHALGETLLLADVPVLGKFFTWDHTQAPTRALVGMPLSALVLIVVSHCTPSKAVADREFSRECGSKRPTGPANNWQGLWLLRPVWWA